MRTLILFALAFVSLTATTAQENRKSPAEQVSTVLSNGTEITINYSSPRVKGRSIWGSLVPYNAVWRTGANEATTISFSEDVEISGSQVKAGTYALFTIPGTDEWTIILNTDHDQWGAYDYDKSKDVLRFSTEPIEQKSNTENLTFTISENGDVTLLWAKLMVSFLVE